MLTLTPETIVAGAIGVGGVIIALKNFGLVTFGKPVERRKCAELCGAHEALEHKVLEMDGKLDRVCEGVGRIEGFLQGRNGFHS